MSRLPHGGMIDRNISVPFHFDGQTYTAHPGDTLASALLANDVRLTGRSFKYHRPRGVMTAGSEEPNALMEVGTGAALTPNTRATMQEVYEGLTAQSQNRWPNLKNDLLAANDALAPFFGAGFYYKTFMWPRALWARLYEPLIRRAAGLGRLSGEADTTTYDKAFAHCDVLVIGSGPAGLMAALTAAKGGAKVILAEEDFVFGGRLNVEFTEIEGQPADEWATRTVAELAEMPNVSLMRRTTVAGAYDGNTYGAIERTAEHIADSGTAPRQVFWRIVAKHAILTSGAIERPIAFPDNDRPGIMLAGAVRTYTNRFAVAPGSRVAVFTNNDDGWRTVTDMQAAGVTVTALIDTRNDIAPEFDCPVYTGAAVVGTGGRLGIERLTVRTSDGSRQQINADCLAVSGGWNPALQITGHMGGKPTWNEGIAAFVPTPDTIPNLAVAGSANGSFSTHAALSEGMAAAKAALKSLGLKQVRPKLPQAEDAPVNITPFWHVADAKGRAWLDFQNDVTTKDIRQAHAENFRSVEHLKRYTTLGMATDQGKLSSVGALAIMAELTGQSIEATGTTISRPPYTPVTFGALGAGGRGKGFAPERRIPSHDFTTEKSGKMVEVGLWHRPAWFAHKDETHWRQSCDREVMMVRNTVGVCDVFTLGKIDIQGPDAAAFLDHIYTNNIASLAVGKTRYGLMLREDGFVLDDGTLARLGAAHYLLTTTTGAAADVLSHLEFQATIRPDLDVHITPVTEQWAQFAVTGPKARDLLAGLVAEDISALPFMGCQPVTIANITARLFRISFSGELGYELALPARYGDALMRALVKRAETLGGGAYGLEALNVLRVEKGFLTHAEMDGRTTAADLGLAAMLSTKKDFIGKVASQRPALLDPNRPQLVGLEPTGPVKQILGGALIFNEGDDPLRENMQGHVSSTVFSPTLGHMIAMALIKGGHARMGQTIRAVDLLRHVDTRCKIVPLPFYDPTGGKARD